MVDDCSESINAGPLHVLPTLLTRPAADEGKAEGTGVSALSPYDAYQRWCLAKDGARLSCQKVSRETWTFFLHPSVISSITPTLTAKILLLTVSVSISGKLLVG